jgi:hypothetical protein
MTKEQELYNAARGNDIETVNSLLNDKNNKIDINWCNPNVVRNYLVKSLID